MLRTVLIGLSCFASAAFAEESVSARYVEKDTWANRSNFFIGARGGVGIPPDANGVAANAAVEVGIATSRGIGIGLNVSWMQNTPGAPALNIPPTTYGLGAGADLRYYFETIEPLTLYPALSLGFLAGPAIATGRNVVLPLLKPGFGARVVMGSIYVNLEFGLANFTIPYLSLALGFQGDRAQQRRAAWEAQRREQRELAEEAEQREDRRVQREARAIEVIRGSAPAGSLTAPAAEGPPPSAESP